MSKEITEDDFYERFKPIPGPDKSDYWQWEEIPKEAMDKERVWTVTNAEEDCDGVYEVISNGVHYVNKVAYMITEIPPEEDFFILVMET